MIIITAYYNKHKDKRFANREKYLLETIDSIEKQSVNNIFHLIVDDGSDTDILPTINKDLLNPEKRIIIRREKGKDELLTSTNAKNFGINFILNSKDPRILCHKYVTFIDSDDLLLDLKKRDTIIMSENPSFLYSNAILFSDFSDKAMLWSGLPPETNPSYFWIKGQLPYPTMTWSVEFIRKLKDYLQRKYGFEGPFDPNIGSGEDVDIAMSSIRYCKEKHEKMLFLPIITAAYRIHDNSLASTRNPRARREEENSVLIRHFGRSKLFSLHMRRFLLRPECYFDNLYHFKNLFRKSFNKSEILGET